MRILFDLRRVGLGNNGGSATVIRSANQLVEMAHEVTILDGGRNQHTWCSLFAKHIRPKKNSQVPDADVVIATGYKSVGPTVRLPERCGIKAHWIRGWETWVMPEEKIIREVMSRPTVKLVNSICLERKLKKHGFKSYIIRPGYDTKLLYPMNLRGSEKHVVLGGLYHGGVHRNTKRIKWIFDAVDQMKKKYNNVQLWMLGAEQNPNNPLIDRYLRSPKMKDKNKFYNGIDIWLAPTQLEGLHLPPAEAMLTECPVISTKAELSGTQDYIFNGRTGLMSDNDLPSFINNIEWLYTNPKAREVWGIEGRTMILELGDRWKNMQKMIDLFRKIKEN